jgi:hypothetical protein
MTRIDVWDHELRATAGEVSLILQAAQAHVGDNGPTAFERLGRAADDGQFFALLQELRQNADGIVGLPPRLSALFHWIGVLAQKFALYYESQSRLLAKMMWLKLVQGRLGGEAAGSSAVSDQEVVEMAIRKANVQRTRDFLQSHLQKLQREKADLHRRYQALDTQKSNYRAAMSMRASFGQSWREAVSSPLMRSVDRLFSRLTLWFRTGPSARVRAEAMQELADQRTSKLISEFKDIALNPAQSRLASQQVLSKLKQSRRELNELENLLQRTEAELQSSPLPQPRIHVIKNGNKTRRKTL